MKLISNREDWDRVAALLSADWFLPFWHIIELPIDTGARTLVCRRAKAIVRSFMGASTAYVNIDFSDARLLATRDKLFELLEEEVGISIADILTSHHSVDHTTLWLLDALTLQAIGENASNAALVEHLAAETRTEMRSAYSLTELHNQSNRLELISQQSNTPWDEKLRDWSPGQPTWLTDWLFARSFDGESFAIFWAALKGRLGNAEIGHVRSWYISQAKALADKDAEIMLPHWMT